MQLPIHQDIGVDNKVVRAEDQQYNGHWNLIDSIFLQLELVDVFLALFEVTDFLVWRLQVYFTSQIRYLNHIHQSDIDNLRIDSDVMILCLMLAELVDVNAGCYAETRASYQAYNEDHYIEPFGDPSFRDELLKFANLSGRPAEHDDVEETQTEKAKDCQRDCARFHSKFNKLENYKCLT